MSSEWEKATARARARVATIAQSPRLSLYEQMCAECGHSLGQHDPEDGTCDAWNAEALASCNCGRRCAVRVIGDSPPNVGFRMRCTEPHGHDGPDRFEPDPPRIDALLRAHGPRNQPGFVMPLLVEAMEEMERRLIELELRKRDG